MTESTHPSEPIADSVEQAEQQNPANGNNSKPTTGNRRCRYKLLFSLLPGITALVISLLVAVALFFQYQKYSALLDINSAANRALKGNIALLQSKLDQADSNLNAQRGTIELQAQQLGSATSQLNEQKQLLGELQNKLTTLSRQLTQNSGDWLIAQADFLVKLAGRKLWIDQDISSAILLLKSADNSLAKVDDPSLVEVHRLLAADINTLTSIQPIDSDGLVLRLTQLATEVAKLPHREQRNLLASTETAEPNSTGTLQRWYFNLQQSLRKFLSSFVSVHQRSENDTFLMRPEQIEYLQENMRMQLLVATQAVYRQQQQQYQNSLATVAKWINNNFEASSPITTGFLQQLDDLKQKTIAITLPQQLQSQASLEQLIRNRLDSKQISAPHTVSQEQKEES